MDFYRVGDKLISEEKLYRTIEKILTLRASGLSQVEVAQKIGCDRTFISRLETLAEVRKGGSVGIIGFPLKNTKEIEEYAQKVGVDFTFLMTDKERWEYIQTRSGLELLNDVMGLITKLQDFDTVIMIGSDMRIKLAEALLGEKAVGIKIGESPIEEDIELPVSELERIITAIKGN